MSISLRKKSGGEEEASFYTLYRTLQVGCGRREIKIWVDWLSVMSFDVMSCPILMMMMMMLLLLVFNGAGTCHKRQVLGQVGRKYDSKSLLPLRILNPWPLLLRAYVCFEKLGFGIMGPKPLLGNLQILGNRPSALIVGNRVHRGPWVFEIVCCVR